MIDYEESAGIQEDSDSDLQSMPDDDLRSVSGFEAVVSDDTNDNKVSHSAHTSHDIASAERLSIPDHLDHICEEVIYLYSRLRNMESSIVQTVSDEIKSSVPAMITNTLKEQLSKILSATLKDCLPLIVNESLQTYHPTSNRFVTLQKELSKVIKSEVAKKVQVVGLEGVREDLQSQTKHISKFSSSFQDMQTQLQNAIPAPTQGEHKAAENITPPELSPETQGKHAYKESTLLVSDTKVNEESGMVLYNHEKDLVDLITTEQDSEDDDDDDLDKQPLSKRFKIMHLIPSKPHYVVNSRKEATMKITRGDNPLNLIVHPNFRLKQLGFNEWLEAKRLGLPPPLELATFGLTAEVKKRKRAEFIKEMFVIEDIRVDGINKNLSPPPRVVPIEGLVIKEPELSIKEPAEWDQRVLKNLLVMGLRGYGRTSEQRDSEVMKGLSECKASESNAKRIQVKDIVKEVEDYLKIYSSARMDISWYVEGIH
ncbi:hypothetical protein Tco_0542321 [Tanacetum coccineum]